MKILYLFFCRLKKERIYITKAQLCGDGSFINVKYELTRPDKVKGKESIYLIEEQTCKRFYLMRLPRYGLIQTKHNKYQHSGILLFCNSDRTIKSESKVTLVFGKLEAKHIKVV